ncbi:ABC transporter substrate-binding protein [Amycolatopsis jiangsuensis]|uniref:Peptide/nickel transport system substrate-binding protein n=1 Tax=Amycolatopsis jiangsuensis TaxID=1181879 RepID=A0A840IS71_9PSEU|nr:ABC transporter substrate-binding protein [Amycolatopsis jiangsuensis]MBB4684295.1 peptide/nickel transport system substrate-binding protein [Amycolatopsis jiangsuensis]
MSRSTTGTGPSFDRRALLRYTGLAAVAFSPALAACGGPPSTIRVGNSADLITAVIGYGNNQSWDPLQTASAFSMAGFLHSYESLVEGDPVSREPYAGLAKALPADLRGTRLRFELRPGAKWHDGQPVLADDVVFTYARVLDPQENVLIHSFFSQWLTQVRKVDERAVEFVLKFPFSYALQRIQMCKIVPKHVFENNWGAAAAGTVVGSGPYRVSEQAPLSHTVFERFEDYNGPRPAAYRKMIWKSVVDSAPRVAAVSGARPDAQIVENIPPANADQLRAAGRTVEFADGGNNLYLMFNTAHAPFGDRRVRQALHYAIDKEKMIEIGLRGAGSPGTSFINPELPQSQPAAEDFRHDPAKAKKLLAEAGVTNLRMSLSTTNTSLVLDCVKVIKEGWDAIGVQTTLDSQDTKALFSKLDNGTDFQAVATTANAMQFGNDPDLLIRYYYDAQSLMMTEYARWTGADAQALLTLQDRAAAETDDTKRSARYRQLLDLISREAVIYPLVFTRMGTAWDPREISGVRAQGYPGINLNQAEPA